MEKEILKSDRLQMKAIAQQIKNELRTRNWITYGDLIEYVEQKITTSGFLVCFPTLVLPDRMLSNITSLKSNFKDPLIYDLLTVDFGIKSQKGDLIDTAITLIKNPYYLKFYQLYNNLVELVIDKINEILKKKGYITNQRITSLCNKIFSKTKELRVIESLAAHVIKKDFLHYEAILMAGDPKNQNLYRLEQGSIFTFEPHVSVGVGTTHVKPSNIVKTKSNQIDSKDFRLQGPDQIVYNYSGLSHQCLCFYEEDTYIIEGRQLKKLS